MKNAKIETADKGASDKSCGDKLGWEFFPTEMSEVPPAVVLQKWGRRNLRYLSTYWELTLSKGITAAGCLCPTDVIRQFMQNIGQALILSDDSFPLLPDLRSVDNWVEIGEEVLVYEIICEAGKTHRKLKSHRAIVTSFEKAKTPPDILEVHLRIIQEEGSDEKPADICKFDTVVYDICSPYIMRGTEVSYFSSHPDALSTWTNLCGMFYPSFKINVEMKEVIVQEFESME